MISDSTTSELQKAISLELQKSEWTYEEAVQLLFLIQLSKSVPTPTQFQKQIENIGNQLMIGIKNGKLHNVANRMTITEKNISSSAIAAGAGTIGISSIVSNPLLTLILPPQLKLIMGIGTIAATVLPLRKKNKSQNIDSMQIRLIPAEVKTFAEQKGMWFKSNEAVLPTINQPSNSNSVQVEAAIPELSIDNEPELNITLTGNSSNDELSRIKALLGEKGVDINYIPDYLEADDLNELLKTLPPVRENDAKNIQTRNGRISSRKVQAINYMLAYINAQCKCRHDKFAKTTLKHDDKWNKTIPYKLLSIEQLNEIAIIIVHKSRRYPLDGYNDENCNCKITGHA